MARRYTFRPKFHLTPIDNALAIKKNGLLPDHKNPDSYRVWMCDWQTIPHISQHLLEHHGKKLLRYSVFSIRFWNLEHEIRKHSDGIYYYTGKIAPIHIDEEFAFWAERGVDVSFSQAGGVACRS